MTLSDTPKFTPGPWRVDKGDVVGANNVMLGSVADLSLIAAAPDLYSALNAVLHAKIIYVGGGPEESIAECGIGGDLEIVRTMIVAALSKAEGRS